MKFLMSAKVWRGVLLSAIVIITWLSVTQAQTHNVIFVATYGNYGGCDNLGTNGPDSTLEVAHNAKIDISKVPSPSCSAWEYSFGGWYLDTSWIYPWNFDVNTVTDDIYLHAKWKPQHIVTFDRQNGYPPKFVYVASGDTIPLDSVPILTRANYRFDAWYTTPNAAANSLWNMKTGIVNSAITLYANWVRTYIITYNTRDGQIDILPDTADSGAKIQSPADVPTKTGFKFDGWYRDTVYTSATAWNFNNAIINRDTTLYAKWIPVYNVTFKPIDGIFTGVSPLPVDSGSYITMARKPADPIRNDDKFINWYSDEAYTTPIWNFATSVVNKDTILYAKWTKVYTVTFNANNGTLNPNVGSVKIDTNTTILSNTGVVLPSATRDGYRFDGWFTDNNSYTDAWNLYSSRVHKDTELYAKWTQVHTVTFNTQGGGVINPITVEAGAAIKNQKPANPQKADSTFDAWFAIVSGDTTVWDFNSDIVTSDITLYAKWRELSFVITFDLDGGFYGNSGSVRSQIISVVGDTVEAPDTTTNKLLKTGYYFGGWFEVVGGTYVPWIFSAAVTRDVKLTARWNLLSPTQYVVTFISQGLTLTQLTVNNGSLVSMPIPVVIGYVFDGWYRDTASATSVWNFNTNVVTSNVTLYAKWKPAIPTAVVTFDTRNDDGDVTTLTVEVGYKVSRPGDPIWQGYIFDGWFIYTNRGDTITWDFNANVVTRDTTLYAKWVSTAKTWSCGNPYPNNVIAILFGEKLTIRGAGRMVDYDDDNLPPWHEYRSAITTVVIESGVASIGNLAFSRCLNLTSVTIPISVTSIGDWAFYDCRSLKSVTIPVGVSKIGSLAFYNCSGLKSITSLNPTPPTALQTTFVGVDTIGCALYVPYDDIVEDYKNAVGWKNFFNIGKVSVATATREIYETKTVTTAEVAARLPTAGSLTCALVAGPNPAAKSGVVNFYRKGGKRIVSAKAVILDASGNFVRKIAISDKSATNDTLAIVGSWNMKDAKDRKVCEGAYLLKGVITTVDGTTRKVSLIISVR